ncbi:uroporphyrinogen-III C-methyltransferase [Oligoflexus tunisiensis]|uniref:uroporphyrinogen-III C-methyltransferase n=1 Tax=Oligoflexus tunisiensis TaxID=708132 RepID=UPI00114C8FE4|nr:uroporphyrinogen-III C-methyltransferase [Oligoflexus tunisiensis]
MRSGFVALVGAGPGHVDYLTLAGLKALQNADVILYDALLSADFRALFPKKAKALYVGKRCGRHALAQQQINALIVSHAQKGRFVVRLKGGDPFIFGRGAEEVEALREAGVEYRVIPGVSALNGIAAGFTLPLTLRTGSNEFRAIQGHHLPEDPQWWQDLARYRGTVAIFMGLEKLQGTLEKLLEHGRDPASPLALIESADDGSSHAFQTTIQSILALGYQRVGQGPVIIYLGDNVRFMDAKSQSFTNLFQEAPHVLAAHIH